MKRQFHSFFAGMITTVLIAALALSVMAITGKTTIDVYPIDIMVNGEVFQPTNAQGKPVDVFTYKGTTYAPLRALAVAYGLEVGYDAEKKLATVSEPQPTPTPDTTAKPDYSDWSAEEEAAYQEFKAMWTLDEVRPAQPVEKYPDTMYLRFLYLDGEISDDKFEELRNTQYASLERMLIESAIENGAKAGKRILGYFKSATHGFPLFSEV